MLEKFLIHYDSWFIIEFTEMTGLPLGEVIYIAVKPIFKIYMIIGVGFWLARRKILNVEVSKNISAIAIQVLIPCLAFQKIVSNISNSDIAEIGTIAIVSVLIMGGGSLLCFITGVIAGCPRNWWGGLICCGLLPNISDLPIAYLQTMESSTPVFNDIDKGVSFVMIFFTLQMLAQFNFGAYKLIEMDFSPEIRGNEEEPKDSSNDLLSPSGQTLKSHETLHPPSELDLHSQLTRSSIGSLDSSIISGEVLPHVPVLNSGNAIGRRASIASSVLSPLTKTNTVPQHLLENPLQNNIPETTQDIVRVYSRFEDIKREAHESIPIPIFAKYELQTKSMIGKLRHIPKILTSINYFQLFKNIMNFWISATMQIVSITLILSITICMIPWVQALFVITPQAHIHPAPDGAPPLSFILDFAGYIGAAEVPFGLLLLGGTIGRLRIDKLKGVWKVPLAIVISRLFLFPIIGCAFNYRLHKDGLFYGEDILYFISNINFCLPPATSLIYITAFYTPVDDKPHIQMDFLALVYIANYICLVVCLPFVTTYTMKVSLGF